LDATNEWDIAAQQHVDETNAMLDVKGRTGYLPRS